MKRTTGLLLAATFVSLAAPAFAEGDAKAGETIFNKCKTCHSIVAPDGTEIQKGGKIGPNLYGVVGRQVGSFPGYTYDEDTVAVGTAGTKWDEAMIADYVVDPTAWLQKTSGKTTAHSKMAFKLATGGADVAAYLASVAAAK